MHHSTALTEKQRVRNTDSWELSAPADIRLTSLTLAADTFSSLAVGHRGLHPMPDECAAPGNGARSRPAQAS